MFNKVKRFFVNNAAAPNRRLTLCRTTVDKSGITRKSIDGVEHIVVTSKTLPDNIVMNGIFYPADEIAKSFASLSGTLAPIEHPTDKSGGFLSATDPKAIVNFHAGAHNENVRQENGRVLVDKVINVQYAQKSEKGLRLLDRINEIETNSDPRPIHTSTGIFMEIEDLDEPVVNAAGQEYTRIARNMIFDHDAILLDSVGAAQPSQGVGMAVNAAGEKIDVECAEVLNEEMEPLSHNEIRDGLDNALGGAWIMDIKGDQVFYEKQGQENQIYSATFEIDGRDIKIVGAPIEIERVVTYTPKTNHEGNAMKEKMIAALNKAGVETKDLTDDQIFAAYNNALIANQSNSDGKDASDDKADLAAIVANALKPLTERLDSVDKKLEANESEEVEGLVSVIINSKKYPGLSEEDAKNMSVDSLKNMAANCKPSFGLPSGFEVNASDDESSTLTMPE